MDMHVDAFTHTFTVTYGTHIHTHVCFHVHTWVFRVAPVLSDPWTKDLLPHRMAVVTKCRRVSRNRLTEAA